MVKKWHYLALKSERTFDGKKCHNRPVTNSSRLLRGITSNHNEHFYCLNCFHSYSTYNKLKNMKKYVMYMIVVIRKCIMNTTIH